MTVNLGGWARTATWTEMTVCPVLARTLEHASTSSMASPASVARASEVRRLLHVTSVLCQKNVCNILHENVVVLILKVSFRLSKTPLLPHSGRNTTDLLQLKPSI